RGGADRDVRRRLALDVEAIGDLGLLADQREDVLRELAGLVAPGLYDAESLGALVRDPRPVRLVGQLRPQLLERRLRVGEVPEEEADDHGCGTASPSAP